MVQNTTDQNMDTTNLEELAIESDFSENADTESDADECDETELEDSFPKKYVITTEKALALNRNYILNISCTNESFPKICAGLSNKTCEVFSLKNCEFCKTATLNHENNVINVKFGSDTNLLYTGSTDCIKLWDLRTSGPVTEFKDTSEEEEFKPLLHFDTSPNNRLLCAGTELYKGDAFILFWDIRKNNLLGGYWESHTDDITKVMFHPTDNNKLASSSTDGLINIYNLEETNEDDALLNTLNTDSTVEQIHWYCFNNQDNICCVTHTADVQLWDTEEAVTFSTFSRADIAKAIKRKSADHCYVANIHAGNSGEVFILAGSNWNKGECVRSINIENNDSLLPNFILTNNKQRIRASWFNQENDLLVTGGEQCILSVWQQRGNENSKISLKNVKKYRNRNVKPY